MKSPVTYTSLWYIGPIWLLLLGAFMLLAGFVLYDDHRFAVESVHVMGSVEGREMRPYQDRHGNLHYDPTISFEYPVGMLTGRATQSVKEETYDDLEVDGPIPVIFLRDQPGHYRIDMPAEKVKVRLARFGSLLAVLMTAGLGGWLFTWTARRNRLFRRLVDQGMRCRGEVLELVSVYQYRAGTHTYLRFCFSTGDGRKIEGRSNFLGWNQRGPWRAGDLIDVWYDPAQPTDFTIDLNHPYHPASA